MMARIFPAAFAGLLFAVSGASAAEYEQYCNVEGFAAPVRQTLVVLDEQHVFPETGQMPEPRNAAWRRFVGNLLFVEPPHSNRISCRANASRC